MQANEINKFNDLASYWWDLNGPLKTLHQINPARLEFIQQNLHLTQKKVLDLGCGGGILSESLSHQGACVTGIDLAPDSILIAKEHAKQLGLEIDYQCIEIEAYTQNHPNAFDCVIAMELLEHVTSPESLISDISKLVAPKGLVFLSTLNRNLKSYLLGILASEYIFKILPRNTHDYQKFIKPHELAKLCRKNNLEPISFSGLNYNPLTGTARLSSDISVNYLLLCQKND